MFIDFELIWKEARQKMPAQAQAVEMGVILVFDSFHSQELLSLPFSTSILSTHRWGPFVLFIVAVLKLLPSSPL